MSVHSGRILALSILAGLIAGGILAALNLALVQPYLSRLTEDIIDELMADGEFDEEEFDSRVRSIYLGQTVGSLAMGLAAGALIGGVYAFAKMNSSNIASAILVAGIAWFVLYVIPSVKYPPSALAMFDGEAASQYYPLYFGYLSVSGLAALCIAAGFRRRALRNKVFGMAAAYLVAVAVAYVIFPNYDLDASFDQPVLNSWRASVSAAMTGFWFSAGIISGILCKYGALEKEKDEKVK